MIGKAKELAKRNWDGFNSLIDSLVVRKENENTPKNLIETRELLKEIAEHNLAQMAEDVRQRICEYAIRQCHPLQMLENDLIPFRESLFDIYLVQGRYENATSLFTKIDFSSKTM